ncbi:MAG: DUF975 family protein [Clostridia bacterium]|nr:DUF975 family protein [Clostridia bacterium]
MFGKIKIYGKAQLLGTTFTNILLILSAFLLICLCLIVPVGVYFILNSEPQIFSASVRNIIIIFSALLSFLFIFVPTVFGFSNKFFYFENSDKNSWLCWYKPLLATKSIRVYLTDFFLKTFWFFVFNIPSLTVISMTVFYALNFGIAENIFLSLIILASALLLCGGFFTFVFTQRYFLFPYLIMANPKIKIKEAVRNSTVLMDDLCFKTALFKLSFIPWFLSCIFIIPIFYVIPYYKTSCGFYFKECNSPLQ